jgi:hypothetical protein
MAAVGADENEPVACIYHQDDFMGAVSMSSLQFG